MKGVDCVGHAACTGKNRNTHGVLARTSEGKTRFGRPWLRWTDNITMYLRETSRRQRVRT